MRVKRIGLARRPDDFSTQIAAILFEEDPLQISIGINADEYDSEAGTIAPRLGEAASAEDVLDIVYAEFCGWFGLDDAGDKASYLPAAVRIWNTWREGNATAQAATGPLPALTTDSNRQSATRGRSLRR